MHDGIDAWRRQGSRRTASRDREGLAQRGEAAEESGPLPDRVRRPVKLALAIGARSEGAAHSHTRRALVSCLEVAVSVSHKARSNRGVVKGTRRHVKRRPASEVVKTPPEIARLPAKPEIGYWLRPKNVRDLRDERGLEISHVMAGTRRRKRREGPTIRRSVGLVPREGFSL